MKQKQKLKWWPYITFWLFGLVTLLLYGGTLYMERTAPVNPVTGFHESAAGTVLVFLFPLMSIVQTLLMLVGLALIISGMLGKGNRVLVGAQALLLGLAIAAINYGVSS